VLVALAAILERREEAKPPSARRFFFIDPSTCSAAQTHLVICATFDALFAVNAATGAAFIKVSEL
jgi:hypothetical protein